MKLLRLLTGAAFLLIGAVGLFVLFLLVQHFRMAADFSESERLAGLQRQVRVDIDSVGVIHIIANSESDAIRAAGYCAAAGHLWEMEQVRLAAMGKLAEAYGADFLDVDLVNRGLGLDSLSVSFYQRLPTNTRQWLSDYVAGINAFITARRFNSDIRFQLNNIEPTAWKPSDPLLLQRFIAWHSDGSWRRFYLKTHLKSILPPAQRMTLSQDSLLGAVEEIPALDKFWTAYRKLRHFFGQYRLPAVATYMTDLNRLNRGVNILVANSWTSELPLNRQKIHFITPEMEVAGFSIPGIPGVQQGRSRDSAWAWLWLSNHSIAFRKARLSEDLASLYLDSTEADVTVERVRIRIRESRPVNWVRHTTGDGLVLNPSLQQEYYDDTWWLRWAGFNYTDEFTLLRKLMTETGREALSPILQRTAYPGRLLLYDADHEAGLAAVQSTYLEKNDNWTLASNNLEISLAPRKSWAFPPYLQLPLDHPIVGDDGIKRQETLQEWAAQNPFTDALMSRRVDRWQNLPVGDMPEKMQSWLRLINDDAMNAVHPQGEEILFILRQWQNAPSDNPVAEIVLTVWKAQLLNILLMQHLDAEWRMRFSETPDFYVPWLRQNLRQKSGIFSLGALDSLIDNSSILTEAFTQTLLRISANLGSDIADWEINSYLAAEEDAALANILIYEVTSGLENAPVGVGEDDSGDFGNLPGKMWEIGSWSNWGGYREEGLKMLYRRSVKASGPRHALSPFLQLAADEDFYPIRFASPVKSAFRVLLEP